MLTCWCSCGCNSEFYGDWDPWLQDWYDTICPSCYSGGCLPDDDEEELDA